MPAFALLSNRYGPFDLDAAAENHNALCTTWFGPGSPWAEDALATPWGPIPMGPGWTGPASVFCNPPYGRGWIVKFIEKARSEALARRASTTLLLPSTIEVPWFHQYVWDNDVNSTRRGVDLFFFPKRISFLRPDGSRAGQPGIGSMAVTFRAGLR